MTPEGARRAAAVPTSFNEDSPFNGPEDLSLYDRCITRGVLGSVLPVVYGNGSHILQTPEYVVIRHEMVHETRVIPLDGRPHVGQNIRQFMGDSRARWDRDTLVVETTNFNGRTGIGANGRATPTSRDMRLLERITRVAPDTLHYEATIDDPATWIGAWTFLLPLTEQPGYQLFEYACHEGNLGLRNILSAARAQNQ